jgi:hypothetical protein
MDTSAEAEYFALEFAFGFVDHIDCHLNAEGRAYLSMPSSGIV